MRVSKYEGLKPAAIRLRKQGFSIPEIEKRTGIPRSNLSGWLSKVTLTVRQKERLHNNWLKALVKARKGAVKWHNAQKDSRLEKARLDAQKTLSRIDYEDLAQIELALSMLYLGEGTKAKKETGLGNSNPDILRFFITCLKEIYRLPKDKIKCELHLRADQKPEQMVTYWSKELDIPRENFYKPHIDLRTKGKTTFDHYKGVCQVRCGNVAIQRKLMYISQAFCEQVENNARVAHLVRARR